MKETFALTIEKPCSANWNEMTPNEQGKFCSLCQLTVVDFTQMKDEEIKAYFRCYNGQKTCGRFNTTQLREQNLPISKAQNFKKSYWKVLMLSTLAFLAFLTGCRKPSSGTHLMGEPQLMGDTIYIEKVDTSKTAPTPIK